MIPRASSKAVSPGPSISSTPSSSAVAATLRPLATLALSEPKMLLPAALALVLLLSSSSSSAASTAAVGSIIDKSSEAARRTVRQCRLWAPSWRLEENASPQSQSTGSEDKSITPAAGRGNAATANKEPINKRKITIQKLAMHAREGRAPHCRIRGTRCRRLPPRRLQQHSFFLSTQLWREDSIALTPCKMEC